MAHSFDFEPFQGQRLTAVAGKNLQLDQVARTSCDALALHLERTVLHVSVDVDTDELIVCERAEPQSRTDPAQWARIAVLEEYIGYELGWCWIARNYLGYADTVMLSFSGIEPEIALCGVSASLWIYRLTRI